MKVNFTLFLTLLSLSIFSQTEIFLSEPIAVAPDQSLGYRAPRIAILGDGSPIVYWGKTGSPHRMFIAKLEADSFLPPLEINTNGIEVDLWSAGLGPQLAVSGNTVFLVFETYGEGIWCSRSLDGGVSFDNPVSVYDLPPGRVATLPTVAIDPEGNPVVSFVTTNQSEAEARYEIAVSLDGGLSFEPAVVANLASSEEVCECCPATMNIPTSDDLLLVFRRNDNNIRDIWASKSTDGGMTFPIATDLDDTDWETFTCPSSGPHSILFGDSLITSYYSVGEGSAKVYFSTMNINTMEKGQQIDLPSFTGEELSQNYPRLAGNQDTIGIAWEETAGNSKDIVLAYSINGTSDLTSQLVKIADGLFLSERYPDIAFSNGVFHIVYENPSSGDVMYRQASFSNLTDNVELEETTFKANIYPNPFNDFIFVAFENPQNEWLDVELYNQYGQLLEKQKTNNPEIEIDSKRLVTGIYFLNLTSGNRTQTIKLIKA